MAYSYTRFPLEAELDTPDYGIIETSVTPDLDFSANIQPVSEGIKEEKTKENPI